MHLPKRDVIATGAVAAVGLLWAIGSALPGTSSSRATGVAVLALGLAASASAVVPTFGASRVITGRAYPPAPPPRTPTPKAARPPAASCSPPDHRNSAGRRSDHAD